mgnify:CR=1 FL=1
MENATIVAIVIFVIAYALIISEKVHRTIVGLFGAMLMILFGIIGQETAVHHIDFNTLGLLMGMMIIVNITSETGLFNFLAIWAAQKVKARPVALLVVLSTITMVCSALLDNVTTVLLTVPITFSITSQLKVDVMPYLISQILSSNIGGTATLIGDPPNIMIGSAVGLDFMAFVENLTVISIIIFILVQFILIGLYRKGLHTQPELQEKIMRLPAAAQITDHALLRKCLTVIFLTITLFVLHGSLGLESATVALSGAGLLLLLTATRDENAIVKVLSKIEWPAIFFFGGLFILVGALVWLVPLVARFENTVPGHAANAIRLAVGYLGRTVACLAVVVAPAALILWAPRARMATAWFMVLLGVAFQGYLMALIQRGVIDRLREASPGTATSPAAPPPACGSTGSGTTRPGPR